MKTWEFQAQLNPDRTLPVPADVASQMSPGQTVHVVLVVHDPTEDQEWARMAAAEFVKGYADSDAIYDQLSSSPMATSPERQRRDLTQGS